MQYICTNHQAKQQPTQTINQCYFTPPVVEAMWETLSPVNHILSMRPTSSICSLYLQGFALITGRENTGWRKKGTNITKWPESGFPGCASSGHIYIHSGSTSMIVTFLTITQVNFLQWNHLVIAMVFVVYMKCKFKLFFGIHGVHTWGVTWILPLALGRRC